MAVSVSMAVQRWSAVAAANWAAIKSWYRIDCRMRAQRQTGRNCAPLYAKPAMAGHCAIVTWRRFFRRLAEQRNTMPITRSTHTHKQIENEMWTDTSDNWLLKFTVQDNVSRLCEISGWFILLCAVSKFKIYFDDDNTNNLLLLVISYCLWHLTHIHIYSYRRSMIVINYATHIHM